MQDDLSIQIALMYALAAGRLRSDLCARSTRTRYAITPISQEGTETHRYQIGRIETVVYASQHPGSPRVTRFWCAPSQGFVPLRVQQKRIDDVEWTMEIESLKTQLSEPRPDQAFGSVTPRCPWYLPPRSA